MKQRYFALALLLAASFVRASDEQQPTAPTATPSIEKSQCWSNLNTVKNHFESNQNLYGALLFGTAGYLANKHGHETLSKGLFGAGLGFGYNALTGKNKDVAAPVIGGLALAGLHKTGTLDKASKLLSHKS